MNKSLFALLFGVCLVGMGLLMYQEKREDKRTAEPASALSEAAPSASGALSVPPQAVAPAGREAVASPPPRQTAENRTPALPEKIMASVKPAEREARDDAQPARNIEANIEAGNADVRAPIPASDVKNVGERKILAAPEKNVQGKGIPGVPAQVPQAAGPSADPAPAALSLNPPPKVQTPAVNNAKLAVIARDKGATVRLSCTGQVRYDKPMILTSPDRVVVDVDGISSLKAPGVPKNPMVSNVRLGKHDGKTRIVIDLTAKPGNARFILSQNRDTLDIRLDQ
ncbi:MAG: AMIN domain-containing protein [Desulfovibrio sp.]|jgi:hypothetical protein|nr:AMIN domain-containing protein [Desulfovibrio sp.]